MELYTPTSVVSTNLKGVFSNHNNHISDKTGNASPFYKMVLKTYMLFDAEAVEVYF